jgi:hypothetical protein
MPWKEVSPMEELMRFASLAETGRFEFVQLCKDFGTSRKNGYKWLWRYREFGVHGLMDLSRAPKSSPCRTDLEIETLIVSERRKHPTWGPKKIGVILGRVHHVERVPARSTVGEILKRNGLYGTIFARVSSRRSFSLGFPGSNVGFRPARSSVR